MATGEKAPGAFKTIGELSSELGVAQHILRYWESKFPQLRPLQRAGNRRYYRPADVELARTKCGELWRVEGGPGRLSQDAPHLALQRLGRGRQHQDVFGTALH